MNVRDLIKLKGNLVFTVEGIEEIEVAAKLLIEEKIGALVVTDASGKIVGVLSERDIVRGLAEHGDQLEYARVEMLMTRQVISCKPNHSIGDVMRLMIDNRVRHLPVINGEELYGVISINDIVKCLADMEDITLRDFLALGQG